MNNAINTQLINQLSVSNILGEGIQAHPNDQEIWWTDIQNNTLFRYEFATTKMERFFAPEPICSFAFVKCQNTLADDLLVAFASGIAYFNPHTQELRWIHANLKLEPRT